jgi:hypothetical protein
MPAAALIPVQLEFLVATGGNTMSLNRAMLIGYVGHEIATDERFTDKNGENRNAWPGTRQ